VSRTCIQLHIGVVSFELITVSERGHFKNCVG